MKSKLLLPVLLLSSSAVFAETSSSSTPIDLSQLTNSVNFQGVITAIMAVAASLVALYAAYAGVRWVLRMVKSS
ncbi:major capsid protein [Citrobacter sp. S-77]|uniref:major capsid protein n=1 Tax=Citrobacter sp. S-77 TaxID=1080067 RepID=UPI0008FF9150|nr:major capsid protein [Citrobacter sp. S-77]